MENSKMWADMESLADDLKLYKYFSTTRLRVMPINSTAIRRQRCDFAHQFKRKNVQTIIILSQCMRILTGEVKPIKDDLGFGRYIIALTELPIVSPELIIIIALMRHEALEEVMVAVVAEQTHWL